MKIVKILGGLGNQMFQYALLVALRETFHEEVLMDPSVFDTYKLHNGFELERVFNVTARRATTDEIRRLSRYTTSYFISRIYSRCFPAKRTECREHKFYMYYPEYLEKVGDFYYDGYWQNPDYFNSFRKSILKEFTFKTKLEGSNLELATKLSQCHNCVSIHVRRGDYLKHKLYRGLCNIDYYRASIDYVKNMVGRDLQFVIFSNDIQWCQQHLLESEDLARSTFVDWNHGYDSYKDMQLMSMCRVNIIANSSFSWWAAYMNEREDRMTIAPKKWINLPMSFSIQMPEWILL